MAEILALNFVVILVLLLVVAPFVARAFEVKRQANGPGIGSAFPWPKKPAPIEPAKKFPAVTPARASPTVVPPAESPNEFEPDDIPSEISVERVEGNVKASSIKRIGAIIEKRPREAASVISVWLRENRA